MRSEVLFPLLLCVTSPVVFATLSKANQKSGDTDTLQVTISKNQPVSAILGGSLTLPCLVTLPEPVPSPSMLGRHAALTLPHIRWSRISPGQDTEILVARGHLVKVSEVYKGRASLPNYASSPVDLALRLEGLLHSDSGVYRCEVQQGLEDAHDLATVKVTGSRRPCNDTSSYYMATYPEGVSQEPLLKDSLEDFSLGQKSHQEKSGEGGTMEAFPVLERSAGVAQMKEQGASQEIAPTELTQVDISFRVDPWKDSTSESTSEDHRFKEAWSSVQKASGSKYSQHIPEASLKSSDPTSSSEKSAEGLKSVSETAVESSDPTVSSRDTGVGITYLLMPAKNKSRDVFSSSGGSGNHGHYKPMPELYPDPSDLDSLAGKNMQYKSNADLDASILSQSFNESEGSKHNQPMYETNLQSSDLSESVHEISESPSDIRTVFVWSRLNATPSAHLEIGNITSPFSSSVEQATDVLTASPTSWYDIPTNKHQEEKVAEVNETSTSALPPRGDQDLHLVLSTLSSEWDVTTPHTPWVGAKESVPSSAAAWFEVEGQSAEQNSSVLEKPKPVTLRPPGTDVTVTLDDVHRHVRSTVIPQVFESTQQQTMWPNPTAPREQEELEAVGTSAQSDVGGSTGSAGVEATMNPAFTLDPVQTYPQAGRKNNIDGNATWVQSGVMWNNTSTPAEDVEETSGQQWLETPIRSAELGGITDLGLVSADLDSLYSITSGAGPNGFSGEQEILQPGGFAVKLMTSPGPTSPFWAAEAEASGASNVHIQPDTIIPTELEHSGMDHMELEELSEAQEVTFPSVTHTDKSTSIQEGVTQRWDSDVTYREPTEPSPEPGVPLAPTRSPEEPTEVNQHTIITEPAESLQSYTTVVPTPARFLQATPTGSMSHVEEAHNVTGSTAPTALIEVTLSPDGTWSPRWDVETSPAIPQEDQLEMEYTTMHPSMIQGPVPDSSTEPEFPSTTAGYPTNSFTTRSSFETQEFPSSLGLSPSPEEDYFPHLTSTVVPTPLVDTNQAETIFAPTQPSTHPPLPKVKTIISGWRSISDTCFDSPCLNGGTCVDEGGSTNCLCLPTYGGDFCHIDLELCEIGWKKFQGFCYKHFSDRQGWEVAEQQCRMYGGHLASVMSPEEQDFINNNYKEYQWTGLNDKTLEGHFHWSDGNPLLYENWYTGQPDSYFLPGEDCVVMVWHDGGRWSDVPCNYHLSYTCKKGPTSCGKPPSVPNTRVSSKVLQRYETGSMVRYFCMEGFQQRHYPVIRCLPSGQWEEPQVTCVPVFQDSVDSKQVLMPFSQSEEVVLDDPAVEKVAPEFWDIKWNF